MKVAILKPETLNTAAQAMLDAPPINNVSKIRYQTRIYCIDCKIGALSPNLKQDKYFTRKFQAQSTHELVTEPQTIA